MKKQSQSEIQQIAYGTLLRNKKICAYWKAGISQAELGRRECPPISRQAVHKIIKRAQNQRQSVFKRLLDRFIKFIKNTEFPIDEGVK